MDVHLASTIGAQTSQRCGLTPAVRVSLCVSPDTLHIVKGVLVNNGLMGVLKNHPIALVYIVALFILKVLAGFEVHCMPQVFPFFEDVDNGG